MAPSESIILYLYTFSPYGRKVTTYLTLRGIPYTEVHQPAMPPRPDLDAIGVHYRRIPVMSIGRDIYCDSMLVLQKLETLYPSTTDSPGLGAKTGRDKALEHLLEKWTTELVFQRSLTTIPAEFPVMEDTAFMKDRSELWGGTWSKERQRSLRPTGLQDIRDNFEFLETLVGEEEHFVSGSHSPGLADIHALWVFDWLLELVPGSIPADFSDKYPKTFAWRDRFRRTFEAAKAKLPETPVISGTEAADKVLSAGFAEKEGDVDESDPIAAALGLKKGAKVDVFPTDIGTGYKHRETGELVALTPQEAVVLVKAKHRDVNVRVHAPRWNYKVQASDAANGI